MQFVEKQHNLTLKALMSNVVIWFTVDLICFAFEIPFIFISGESDEYVRFVNEALWLLPPSNHLQEMQVLLFCKNRQSIAPVSKRTAVHDLFK